MGIVNGVSYNLLQYFGGLFIYTYYTFIIKYMTGFLLITLIFKEIFVILKINDAYSIIFLYLGSCALSNNE